MFKRGVALIVAGILALIAASPTLAQVRPFRDVPEDHWAYDAITRLKDVNLVEGYPDGTFGGDRTFTRYEMAMVFARTLARLEALIDERIAGHVEELWTEVDSLKGLREADMQATMDAIAWAKADLAEQLGERLGALEDDVEWLKSQLGEAPGLLVGPAGEPGQPGAPGDYRLTPQAEAALERLVHEKIQQAMEDLAEREGVVERITERIVEQAAEAQARDLLATEEARRAIQDAVAEEFRRLGVDEAVAERAAAGDEEALRQAVSDVQRRTADDIEGLAHEFEEELGVMDVRLSNLESVFEDLSERVTALEDEVRDVRSTAERVEADFDAWRHERRTKFSGSAGVEVDLGGLFRDSTEADNRYAGVRAYLRDPRHEDRKSLGDVEDEDLVFDRTRVRQRFDIRAETEPYEGSDLVAELSVVNDSIMRARWRGDANDRLYEDNLEGLAVDSLRVALSSEEGMGEAYYGLLDEDRIDAEGFNRYILDADRFIEPDPVRENHRGTMLAGSYANLRGMIVSVNRDWVTEINGGGPIKPRDVARDGEARRRFETVPGRRYAASVAADLGSTWAIHGGWAAHQRTQGSDALLSVGVNGPLSRNVRLHALGAHDLKNEVSAFEVGAGVDFGAFDLALTLGDIDAGYGYDSKDWDAQMRKTFVGDGDLKHNHGWWLADANAAFLGGQLRGRHYQANAHDTSFEHTDDNRVTRADYGVDVDFLLPFRLDLAYATGKKDRNSDSEKHFLARAAVNDYQLSSNLSWDLVAELIKDNDIEEADHWNDVEKWEAKDKTTIGTMLTWRPWDRWDLYGGYKHVRTEKEEDADEEWSKKTEGIVTLGLDHSFNLSRYTRMLIGYEYQTADVSWTSTDSNYDDKRDPRHTIRAVIDQAISSGGNIRLEAKQITGAGGDGKDKNNATDRIASLAVNFPVARNLQLNVGGHYVDSRGNEPDADGKQLQDYTATEVRAGLSLSF